MEKNELQRRYIKKFLSRAEAGGSHPVGFCFSSYGSAMKAIARRLRRLEDQFGSPGETEYDLCLRQRMDSAERRIAEARNRGELPPVDKLLRGPGGRFTSRF